MEEEDDYSGCDGITSHDALARRVAGVIRFSRTLLYQQLVVCIFKIREIFIY